MSSARLSLLALSAALVPFFFPAQDAAPAPSEGVVTLYAADDLLSSFDFRSGAAGGRIQEGELRLESAQILFERLAAGRISFGFTRDERVEILDLGFDTIAPEERSRDRAVELPLAVFHTLRLGDNGFAIVGPGGDLDPYERADRILGPPPAVGVHHVEPQVGHTYVVRVRTNKSSRDEFFKFEVIGFLPGHSVTLRWAVVPRSS
jgi:hypothetical protein